MSVSDLYYMGRYTVDFGLSFLEPIANHPIGKLGVAALVLWLLVRLVNGSVNRFFSRTNFLEERKEKTIASMIASVVKFASVAGFLFYALSLYVEDLTNLLAGAGVIGIVLGFGAQSLIKDLLSGLFFLYEKQLHQGDFVQINGQYTGTVEEIGFRVLKVREWSGKLLSISNGSIHEVQNYNMERMRVIEKVTTSFYQDPEAVYQALEGVCEQLNKHHADCLLKGVDGEAIEPFQIYGMTSLNESHHGYQYTVVGLVRDDCYWDVANLTRKEIAKALFAGNIKMAEEVKYYRTSLSSK